MMTDIRALGLGGGDRAGVGGEATADVIFQLGVGRGDVISDCQNSSRGLDIMKGDPGSRKRWGENGP